MNATVIDSARSSFRLTNGELLNFPTYARLQSIVSHPHLIFEILAYTVGFQVYLRLRKRYGDPVSIGDRWTVIAAAIAGAALGSKILYWFENPGATLNYWTNPAYLMGGKTIVGALIGGLLAVEFTKRFHGIRESTGDLFAVPLTIGIAIGRIGCFLTGLPDETSGTPTRLPWGVDFGDGVPRHPTQLYEIAFVALLGCFLWRFLFRAHRNGDVFKLFMVAYMGFRVLVEFIKPYDTRIAGLSAIQWICLGVLVYYCPDVRRWILHRTAGIQTAAVSNEPQMR